MSNYRLIPSLENAFIKILIAGKQMKKSALNMIFKYENII